MVIKEQVKKLFKFELIHGEYMTCDSFTDGLLSVLSLESQSSCIEYCIEKESLYPNFVNSLHNIDDSSISIGDRIHWTIKHASVVLMCNVVYKNGEKQQLKFLVDIRVVDSDEDDEDDEDGIFLPETQRRYYIYIYKEMINNNAYVDIIRDNILNKSRVIMLYNSYGDDYNRYKNEEVIDIEVIDNPKIEYSSSPEYILTTRKIECYFIGLGHLKFTWLYNEENENGTFDLEDLDDMYGDDYNTFQQAKDIYLEGSGIIDYYQFGVFYGEYFKKLEDLEKQKQEKQEQEKQISNTLNNNTNSLPNKPSNNSVKTPSFNLKERIDFFKKKWNKEHFFERLIVPIIYIGLLVLGIALKTIWICIASVIIAIVGNIILYYRRQSFIENNAFNDSKNN